MPNVSFTLKTFGLKLTLDMRANVVFTPSRAGSFGPDGILIGRVVVPFSHISETTGVATVELAQTTLLRPATHYIISVEWLDAAPSGWAEINWPLQVPSEGGALSELLTIPWPLGALAIGPIRPNATVALKGLWVDNSREPARLMQKIGPTTWVEVAILGALGDPAAANLILNDTLTRAAVDSRVSGIAAEIISSDGTIIAAATAAVDDALAEENVVTSRAMTARNPTDHGMLTDGSDRPTEVGFDIFGRISDTTMESAEGKGMVRVQPSADGSTIDLVDDRGRKFALGFDAATGMFSERTLMALRNQLDAVIRSRQRPQVLPGYEIAWQQTDDDGNVIDEHRGVNE